MTLYFYFKIHKLQHICVTKTILYMHLILFKEKYNNIFTLLLLFVYITGWHIL